MNLYPLVNLQKAIENGHRNSGFSHEKWWIFPWQNVSSPEGMAFSGFKMPQKMCCFFAQECGFDYSKLGLEPD